MRNCLEMGFPVYPKKCRNSILLYLHNNCSVISHLHMIFDTIGQFFSWYNMAENLGITDALIQPTACNALRGREGRSSPPHSQNSFCFWPRLGDRLCWHKSLMIFLGSSRKVTAEHLKSGHDCFDWRHSWFSRVFTSEFRDGAFKLSTTTAFQNLTWSPFITTHINYG
jgi:hypothetical protein